MHATVSQAEIDKFNQLAATWWDPQGPMWPLHRLNALREPYVLARLRELRMVERRLPVTVPPARRRRSRLRCRSAERIHGPRRRAGHRRRPG